MSRKRAHSQGEPIPFSEMSGSEARSECVEQRGVLLEGIPGCDPSTLLISGPYECASNATPMFVHEMLDSPELTYIKKEALERAREANAFGFSPRLCDRQNIDLLKCMNQTPCGLPTDGEVPLPFQPAHLPYTHYLISHCLCAANEREAFYGHIRPKKWKCSQCDDADY